MERSTVGRILWRAAADEEFRNRTIENLGFALAQEGFLLTDAEMSQLREYWQEIQGLSARRAAERIQALARTYRN
jgi:hypothetical protein